LFQKWLENGLVTRPFFQEQLSNAATHAGAIKFGTDPNDLLRESAFCLIPAAPIANYLDTDPNTKPSMTVDRMGHWSLIVEGANTYSPDTARKLARARMERAVYRESGVLIATDYLVNSGGVIYAAQEHLIKTPDHLRFPSEILGKRTEVEHWLAEHSKELEELAEKRRIAGEKYRDEVIRRNMKELIDLLISDADMLPCEAAEKISVRRIASSESDRTAVDIMAPIPTILTTGTVQEAAQKLIHADCSILAVISTEGNLVGVVTDWDITQATAVGCSDEIPLAEIMSANVISVAPEDGILTIVRKLEHHEISAMPVVDGQKVIGLVSTDLLARRSLLRLLQSQFD
jgi:CBS domain-containing protein